MLKVGDIVKLKRGTVRFAPVTGIPNHRTAKIEIFFADVAGGVMVDRRLGGSICWNVEDLERAPSRKKKMMTIWGPL